MIPERPAPRRITHRPPQGGPVAAISVTGQGEPLDRVDLTTASGVRIHSSQQKLGLEVVLPAMPFFPAPINATAAATLAVAPEINATAAATLAVAPEINATAAATLAVAPEIVYRASVLEDPCLQVGGIEFPVAATDGDHLVFEIDRLGPQFLLDPDTGEFGLRTRPRERDDGLTTTTSIELFPPQGGRVLIRDRLARSGAAAFLRVEESPDGLLQAEQVLEAEGKVRKKIAKKASRVATDILIPPAGLARHLRAAGLAGVRDWLQDSRAAHAFEPLSEQPGRCFPELEMRLRGKPFPSGTPLVSEAEAGEIEVRFGEDLLEIGGQQLQLG